MCDTLIEPACAVISRVIGSATTSVAGDVLSGLAAAVSAGVRWAVQNTATWWVTIPSPNPATEPAITAIQAWLLPVTVAVAIAGMIAAGARMAIARRANPLLDMTSGLLTIAGVATVGTVVPALLLKAGDAWAAWVLQQSTGGQLAQRMTTLLILGNGASPAVVLILSLIAIVLTVVQAALMLFRQAALVILAGVLPLAAAGSIAPLTRPWIRKISSWMLALICYKPAAAAVYAAAFTMAGKGRDPRTVLTGFVMLALSLIALPALMRFFTWTTGTIAGSGGGGQLLSAAAMGAIAVGSMRSRSGGSGGPAQDQAAYLNNRLAPPPGNAPPAAPDSPPGSQPGQPAPPGSSYSQPDPAGSDNAATGATNTTTPTGPPGSSPAMPTGASATSAGAATAGATPAAGPAGTSSAAATGAAAAAGPLGAAAAAASRAAAAGKRQAEGAMEPEDLP